MKTSTKILLPIMIIGIALIITAFVSLFKEGTSYTTKAKVYGRLEPNIRKYSADYSLSLLNYKKNKTEIRKVEYFTWEKAKPGDEIYLTLWEYHPIHPRLNEHSRKILMLGLLLTFIPFGWFMYKGLEGDDWC